MTSKSLIRRRCLLLFVLCVGLYVKPTIAQSQSFVLTGRITEVPVGSGPPISNVTVTLVLNSTTQRTTLTNSTGDFSFAEIPAGSNYEVTPGKPGFTFNPVSQGGTNLSQNRTLFFTGAGSQIPTLNLILEQSGPNPNQAAALDSQLLIRDPFLVLNPANVFANSGDRNTRVAIFVASLQLLSGEPPSAVVVNLIDSGGQSRDIPAESVVQIGNLFAQVVFRLPDNLPVGICTLRVRAHSMVSNDGQIRIRQ